MSPSSTYFRCLVSVLLAGVITGWAPAADVQNLLQTSPFAPAAGTAAPGQAAASLEFRGVFADQGDYFFSLFESATRRGAWVGLNEPGHPFTVRSYDPATETLTAEYQGRTLQLTLKTAKILVSAPAPVPAPANMPTPTTVQPAPPAGTPEAQIVEEIRRRRALRQQSATGSVPPAPPTPVAPPPAKPQP